MVGLLRKLYAFHLSILPYAFVRNGLLSAIHSPVVNWVPLEPSVHLHFRLAFHVDAELCWANPDPDAVVQMDSSICLTQLKEAKSNLKVKCTPAKTDRFNPSTRHPLGPCWDWNRGSCTFDECKYQHSCSNCGQRHPVWNCTSGRVRVRLNDSKDRPTHHFVFSGQNQHQICCRNQRHWLFIESTSMEPPTRRANLCLPVSQPSIVSAFCSPSVRWTVQFCVYPSRQLL